MLWYPERLAWTKGIAEWIHSWSWIGRIDDKDVGYSIALFHVYGLVIVYGLILFTKSPITLFWCTVALLSQIALNLIDRGCILIKAERQYLGKDWYNVYTLFGDILGISMNRSRVLTIYYTIMTTLLSIIGLKFVVWVVMWIQAFSSTLAKVGSSWFPLARVSQMMQWGTWLIAWMGTFLTFLLEFIMVDGVDAEKDTHVTHSSHTPMKKQKLE